MDKAIIKMQPVILNFICIFLIPKFCVLFYCVSKAKVKTWKQDRKEKKIKHKQECCYLHPYDRNTWRKQTVITVVAGSKGSG